jgi:FMN phosphatase YigB (HAD superfamily)
MDLDAVTFDFWDTLLCAPDQAATIDLRTSRVVRFLVAEGYEADPSQVLAATRVVFDTYNQRWQGNQIFDAGDASSLLANELGIEVGDNLMVELTEAFAGTRSPTNVDLTPNVVPMLRQLRDAGLRIGIVCDVGMAPSTVLRGHLERHGIIELFDHWSFSDEVGSYKPDRRIFEHALAGLGGVDPRRVAHVGDLRRTDIAGALGMEMTAIRYRGRKDDPPGPDLPEAHHVLDDHAELAELLGLA